jgi:peptide deformylase
VQLTTLENDDKLSPKLRWRLKEYPPENLDKGYVEDTAIEMLKTMIQHDGIGLAANQVSSTLRMFVTHDLAAMNPTIKNPRYYKDVEEGCLSIPGKSDTIGRATKLTLDFFNIVKWKWENRDFVGKEAHVIQHEVDHLNGVLYTDYAGLLTGRK